MSPSPAPGIVDALYSRTVLNKCGSIQQLRMTFMPSCTLTSWSSQYEMLPWLPDFMMIKRQGPCLAKVMCVHKQGDRPSYCMILLLILVSMRAHCACKRETCTDAVHRAE